MWTVLGDRLTHAGSVVTNVYIRLLQLLCLSVFYLILSEDSVALINAVNDPLDSCIDPNLREILPF